MTTNTFLCHCEAAEGGRGNLNFIIRYSLFDIHYSIRMEDGNLKAEDFGDGNLKNNQSSIIITCPERSRRAAISIPVISTEVPHQLLLTSYHPL